MNLGEQPDEAALAELRRWVLDADVPCGTCHHLVPAADWGRHQQAHIDAAMARFRANEAEATIADVERWLRSRR